MTRYDVVNYISHGVAKRDGRRGLAGAVDRQSTERTVRFGPGGVRRRRNFSLRARSFQLAPNVSDRTGAMGRAVEDEGARPCRE